MHFASLPNFINLQAYGFMQVILLNISWLEDYCSEIVHPLIQHKILIGILNGEYWTDWLPSLDSNQGKRVQSPPCYRYTTRQFTCTRTTLVLGLQVRASASACNDELKIFTQKVNSKGEKTPVYRRVFKWYNICLLFPWHLTHQWNNFLDTLHRDSIFKFRGSCWWWKPRLL